MHDLGLEFGNGIPDPERAANSSERVGYLPITRHFPRLLSVIPQMGHHVTTKA